MRPALRLPLLTGLLASAWLPAAMAQSSGGFQVITPRAEATPQVIQNPGGAADGFQVLAGGSGRQATAHPPTRVAIAARPSALPPQPPESVRPAAQPAAQPPAPTAAPLEPPAPKPTETAAEPALEPVAEPAGPPAAPEPSVRDTGHDNVKHVDSKHPLMLAAHQRTRDSLDEFLRIAGKPPEGTRGFMLKVALRAGGETENIWVGALERRTRKKMLITVSETFSGRLANPPVITKDRKMGDRISFSRSDIRDWMYLTSDKRIIGNHTACAIAAAQSLAARDALAREHGLDCAWTASVTTAQR